MRTAVVLVLVAVAIVALPLVAPAYYVTLMLPFMAYGVVLLGLTSSLATPASCRSGTRSSSASAPTPGRC